MNPKNIAILAALGFGTYFLMTRQAGAGMLGSSPKIAARPRCTDPVRPPPFNRYRKPRRLAIKA